MPVSRLSLSAAVCASLVLLSACEPQRSSSSWARNGAIDPSAAYILPDPGGPVVVGAIQRNLGNAIEHEILLGTSTRTPGQNALSLTVFGRGYRSGEGGIGDRQPTDASIEKEMAAAFPGVDMQIAPFFVQNRYGPFGYAVGRGGGRDTCLYGWQRLEMTSGSSPFYANRFHLQIRLRLCDSRLTERQLLDVMYGYTLASYFGSQYPDLQRVGPPRAGTAIGTESEIRPQGGVEVAMILRAPEPVATARPPAPPPAEPRVAAEVTIPAPQATAAVATPTSAAVAAAGPVVPPPTFGGVAASSAGGTPVIPAPAQQAVSVAREIALPAEIARQVDK